MTGMSMIVSASINVSMSGSRSMSMCATYRSRARAEKFKNTIWSIDAASLWVVHTIHYRSTPNILLPPLRLLLSLTPSL